MRCPACGTRSNRESRAESGSTSPRLRRHLVRSFRDEEDGRAFEPVSDEIPERRGNDGSAGSMKRRKCPRCDDPHDAPLLLGGARGRDRRSAPVAAASGWIRASSPRSAASSLPRRRRTGEEASPSSSTRAREDARGKAGKAIGRDGSRVSFLPLPERVRPGQTGGGAPSESGQTGTVEW
jgi:hypothetical protein